jgi:hypothetical protein
MTKTISTAKAARSTKNKNTSAVAPVEALVLNSVEFVGHDDGEDAMNELIASLNAPIESDEVIEQAHEDLDDEMLAAAVSGAEATEAMIAAATPEGVYERGEAPTGAASDYVPDEEEEAPAKVVAAKPEKEKKEKRVATPRKHYTDKTERLKDKLGSSLAEYSVLTLADAEVTEAELGAVMETTMVIIRSMSGKAQNWAVKLIENLSGKKSSMSEVTARIFKLLQKDGFISTGMTGNLYLDLIAKPYSPGAARAMGSNNLAMMTHLKIIQADGKGRFVANPDSLLLMKANSMLFSAPVAAAPAKPAAPFVEGEPLEDMSAEFGLDEIARQEDEEAAESNDDLTFEEALM